MARNSKTVVYDDIHRAGLLGDGRRGRATDHYANRDASH